MASIPWASLSQSTSVGYGKQSSNMPEFVCWGGGWLRSHGLLSRNRHPLATGSRAQTCQSLYAGEEDGFDPMGFSLAIDIRWRREAELKHARVAMLATVGWIATDLGMRVPGTPFQGVSTIQAHDAMVKFGSMTQMLCWIGYAELFGYLAIIKMMEGETDRVPGDFGLRWLYPKDEQGQYDMQMKELRNGRLAMLAFSGIVTAAVLTGKTWPFFATKPKGSPGLKFASGSTLCGSVKHKVPGRGVVSTKAL